MENNRYRLKEDKLIGLRKIASKGDIVTVISTSEGSNGIVCVVNAEKDDNKFAVLAKLLTPIF
jgi:predicted transcriptional regulator